jgi:hypothetical protein
MLHLLVLQVPWFADLFALLACLQVPSFADLALLYPSLHSGLQQLLDYDGDVEATFCRQACGED